MSHKHRGIEELFRIVIVKIVKNSNLYMKAAKKMSNQTENKHYSEDKNKSFYQQVKKQHKDTF